jgi:hypothetical protein
LWQAAARAFAQEDMLPVTKTFHQCRTWSHLIAECCTDDQKAHFLKPIMDIHGGAGVSQMNPRVDKLCRDAVIWTHLAGDSVQRMKAVQRLRSFNTRN